MNGTQNLFYQRLGDDTTVPSPQHFPAQEFKINEHSFCDKFTDDGITPNKGEFLLLNTYREECPKTSTHFETISTIGEKDLFKANQLYDIVKNIMAYPIPTNAVKWNLGYRRAFKWTDKCRKNPAYSMEEARIKWKLDAENSYRFGLMIAAWVNFIYGGVVLPLLFMW